MKAGEHSRARPTAAAAITVLAWLELSGCALTELGPAPSGSRSTARLDRVVGGDTIVLRRRAERDYVRLIGIDTPETVRPGAAVECGGLEAVAFDGRYRRQAAYDRAQRRAERRGAGQWGRC